MRRALLQDLDGLNRIELMSHDWWGGPLDERADADLTPDDLAWLDRAATLTLASYGRLSELRSFFDESARGRTVRSRLSVTSKR